jgi:hypothetical protein
MDRGDKTPPADRWDSPAELCEPVEGPAPAPATRRVDGADTGYLLAAAGRPAGRASPLTVLTPLPRRWWWPQRAVLRVRRRLGQSRRLREMSFIHFAHWVTIDHFPGERRPTRYAYMLFQSNFDGSRGGYVDAFSVVIPMRMALLWGSSFGFPGARPSGPFRRYIHHNDIPVDHYYSAYPDASVAEIGSALRVDELFRAGVQPVIDTDAHTFATAWRRFVEAAQRDL